MLPANKRARPRPSFKGIKGLTHHRSRVGGVWSNGVEYYNYSGNLIELQFGQGRNWPLGAALSITLLAIVMVALLAYVRNVSRQDSAHG